MSKADYYKKHLKTDISAGLVVFLIALPLCLGISLASGAPLFSGIIAGIVGGIVVGFFSNSQVNVSGPAASVAVIILTAISSLGSYQAVLFSVIIAGAIQVIMGYLRAGTVAYYFPNAMIKGILASIGLILILKQIPHALGVHGAFEGSETFWQSDGHNTFSSLYYAAQQIHPGALIITLVSLLILMWWDRPALKETYIFFQFFPAALAAVIVSIILNIAFERYLSDWVLDANQLVTLPVAGSLGEFLGFFTFPTFDQALNMETYTVALSIAFIASLESLLSTEAGDKLDPYKRRTSTNRELKAQGIGNIVSGLIGGLPVTAVIVRTSANVSAGGRTKIATIIHGFIMLVCVITIPLLLNKIPLAALSAVLFVVGYKLTSVALYRSMFKLGKRKFLPFIITIIAVMFTDLITGIIVGGTVAVFFILRNNYKTPFFYSDKGEDSSKEIKIELSEDVSFLNKANILLTLEHIPEGSTVTIDGTKSVTIDDDILEIFQEYKESVKHKDITLKTINLDEFFEKRGKLTL